MLRAVFTSILFITIHFCFAVNYDTTHVVRQGDMMPSFVFERLNGEKVSSEKLEGKVVVINFFATWCGPCMQELPEIEAQIWNKYSNRSDFELLVIGRQHTKEEMQKFIETKKTKLPIIADTQKEIYSKFATAYIPRLYLIDRKGKIVKLHVGYTKDEFAVFMKLLETELQK
jgi:peroxiredoxin